MYIADFLPHSLFLFYISKHIITITLALFFNQDYLLQLVQKFIKVPVEVCIIALKVLIFIAGNIKFRDTLVDLDAFETISVLLEVK